MTVNINASTNSKRIPIGRCEDNEATRVVFDCSGFSSAYGSGQATLLHRRSKEKISYIVQNVAQSGSTVTWTVSSDDTAFSGEGTLQLMWTVNDVVAHSVFYTTITDPSLTDSSSEPTEVKSALQLLIDSCYTKTEVDTAIANVPTGANWDASEGEDGYIENRPFYTEGGIYTKILDGVYNSPSSSANVAILVDGRPFNYDLVDGEHYRVEFGSSVFDCVASVHPTSNMVMIGNGGSIGGEINPEYNFTLFSSGGQLIGSFGASLSFSMYTGEPEIVHKLDSKYLNLDGKLIASGTGENSEIYNDISNNVASGDYSHAEGYKTRAQAMYSHCEGRSSSLTQKFSYSGVDAPAVAGVFGVGSHCEGEECRICENASAAHAEGFRCYIGEADHNAHAEGYMTSALARYCHSEGQGTVATANASHVGGKYNIVDSDLIYAEIIGNGTSNTNRSNARTLDWSGNESLAGSLTLGMGTNIEITMTPNQLNALVYPLRENHWESPRFLLPSVYVKPDSPSIFTEHDVIGSSSTDFYAVYYLPGNLDLDAISSLEVISYHNIYNNTSQTYVRYLTHRTEASFGTMQIMWSPNCKAMPMNDFAIVKASDFVTWQTAQPYNFPEGVKTIAILFAATKPNQSAQIGNRIEALSLDWTPST